MLQQCLPGCPPVHGRVVKHLMCGQYRPCLIGGSLKLGKGTHAVTGGIQLLALSDTLACLCALGWCMQCLNMTAAHVA